MKGEKKISGLSLSMTNFIPEIIFHINPNKCHVASIPNQMSVYYARSQVIPGQQAEK